MVELQGGQNLDMGGLRAEVRKQLGKQSFKGNQENG